MNHNDTMIKNERRLLYKYMYLSLYCKGSKSIVWGFTVRGSWRPNRTAIFWPQTYSRQRCVFLVLLMLNQRPCGLALCWMMAFFTASYQQLLWTPTQSGAPSPFGLVWISLPHLVYNSVRSLTATALLLSWLSYIIVQRPLNRLLDLWNGMIDRHPAEITVMQFTGHSLPVHGNFFYLVPFRQPIFAHAISSHNCHWNVSPPSGASLWNGIFGRVEGQNTTF